MMGGKWTTHRAMDEDTIDAVQKYLGQPVTESLTRDHLLWGGEGYTPTYWTTLSAVHSVSEETPKHLAMKFGGKHQKFSNLPGERKISPSQSWKAGSHSRRSHLLHGE